MSETLTARSGCDLLRERALGVLGVIAVFLTFLLPLKFGMMTGVPEVATALPSTVLAVVLIFWPPILFSVLSSLLLIGILFAAPPLDENRDKTLLIPLSWILLFLSVLPGFINASTLDFPIIQTALFSGFAAFAMAIYRLISVRPDIKIWLINAIVLSTVITVFLGLNQYLYGFKETLDYIYAKELETGQKVAPAMMSRLLQTRVFATFSICNSLAAHLILTIPVCIWGILNSKIITKSILILIGVTVIFMAMPPATSRILFFAISFAVLFALSLIILKFSDKNHRVISILTLIPILLLILFVFRHTYSRGAFLGLGCAFLFSAMLIPVKLKYKVAFCVLIALSSVFLITSDIAERSLASMTVRFDYYLSALKMFLQHPLCGTGWGDFFHEYTKIKTFHGDEAPHTPHNVILSFASQAGIAGLLASLLVLTAPFYIFFKKGKEFCLSSSEEEGKESSRVRWLNISIITGWAAWTIHSLADFNIQVPGTVATGIILLLIMNSSTFKTSEQIDHAEKTDTYTGRRYLVLWYGCVPIIALITLLFSLHQLKFEIAVARFKKYANLSVTSSRNMDKVSDSQLEIMLNQAASMAQYSPIPWINAANYASLHRKWGAAEMYTLEALKRAPERATLYYKLSEAQFRLGKREEAEKNLHKAAELFPNAYKDKM
jgi:hypothetical protein